MRVWRTRLWLALASVVFGLLLFGFLAVVTAFLYSFFNAEGSVGSHESSGYRYDFDEHQNYWNEDK